MIALRSRRFFRLPVKNKFVLVLSPLGILFFLLQFTAILRHLAILVELHQDKLPRTRPLHSFDVLSPVEAHPTVDVFSIGSKSRWDYLDAQRTTWGNHESIRYFEGISEDHHERHGPCSQGKNDAAQCNTQDKTIRRQPPGIIREDFFAHQSEGWLCAQKRPAIAIGDVLMRKYTQNGKEKLPHWLLLVDDDTIIHMEIFHLSVSQLSPEKVYVLAGSHIWSDLGRDWPYGGSGLALSRGAIRRLLTPLHCKDEYPDAGLYEKHSCMMLAKNRAFEQDNFVDGMSLADLMLAIVRNRKPFCWHSDWMTGWFFSNYLLMGWTIPRFPECPSPYNCQPTDNDIRMCDSFVLSCHYQTPERMKIDSKTRKA